MNRVRVKVCGITRPEDVRALGALGIDAVGFNFSPESPRFLTPGGARDLARLLPSFVMRVGVFRNQPAAEIDRIAREVGLDRLQLHGDENAEFCAGRARPVIKALRIGPGWTGTLAEPYRGLPVLVDAWHESLAGGTGLRSDWQAARDLVDNGFELILAGGIGPDNVVDAVRRVRPAGIDLNSAVEEAPGRKDLARVARVLELIATGTDGVPGAEGRR